VSAFFGVKFCIVAKKKKKKKIGHKITKFSKNILKNIKISSFIYMVQVGSKKILG